MAGSWLVALLFLVLAWGGLTSIAPSAHPFHVSKTQLELTSKGELQVTIHLFLDDLEEALRKAGHDGLFLCTKMEREDSEQYLIEYLRQNLLIRVDGRLVELDFLGKELSNDLFGMWCFLEADGLQHIREVEIHNRILLEVYDDQQNIVQLTIPDKDPGYLLFRRGNDKQKMILE